MPAPATTKALLAASGLVLVVGAALAVAKPGDLGDDDDGPDSAAGTTTTTLPGGSSLATTTTALGGPSDTTVSVPGSVTTAPGSVTTAPGSGIGTDGASVADDATAATGIESMLVPGLALVSAGALARAAGRRTRPRA